jgi:hypothetical protein
MIMPDYSAYFVNGAGDVVAVESIKPLTENEALDAAHRRLVGTRFPCVEVWDLRQRLGVIHRE